MLCYYHLFTASQRWGYYLMTLTFERMRMSLLNALNYVVLKLCYAWLCTESFQFTSLHLKHFCSGHTYSFYVADLSLFWFLWKTLKHTHSHTDVLSHTHSLLRYKHTHLWRGVGLTERRARELRNKRGEMGSSSSPLKVECSLSNQLASFLQPLCQLVQVALWAVGWEGE